MGLALPLGGLALLNVNLFGSPFVASYDRVIDHFDGTVAVLQPSHRTFFDRPFWAGLVSQLLDPHIGLLVSAPILVLALPGLWILGQRCDSHGGAGAARARAGARTCGAEGTRQKRDALGIWHAAKTGSLGEKPPRRCHEESPCLTPPRR